MLEPPGLKSGWCVFPSAVIVLLLLSYFSLCLSPSARRLQSDRGAQTAAEQIQASGEHISSSGSCFYDREVRNPKEPTEQV